jgi:hypothetical protein
MRFDDFCKRWRCTDDEREELVWYLAFLRMRRTVAKLMSVRMSST